MRKINKDEALRNYMRPIKKWWNKLTGKQRIEWTRLHFGFRDDMGHTIPLEDLDPQIKKDFQRKFEDLPLPAQARISLMRKEQLEPVF